MISIGEHYESCIDILKNVDGELIVRKKYNINVPCIRFLNVLLKKHYGNLLHGIMPVAFHESSILKNLEPFRIAPRVIDIEKDCIYLSYEGEPISKNNNNISREDYLSQSKNILHILHRLGIRHNDLLERNTLLKDGVLKIIDFTLAEYPGLDIASHLPEQSWARLNQDYRLLSYAKIFPERLSAEVMELKRQRYRQIASEVYNYHNLGVGMYDESEKEKTPYGYGERYNFDRMAMMVMNYDFSHKNVVDLGCNSGWFSFQSAMLGAKKVLGIDYELEGKMGQSIRYARAFADYLNAPVQIRDQNLEFIDLHWEAHQLGLKYFDVAFILSVLHHIKNKKSLMEKIYACVKDVIFYEDHEFWNEIYDDYGQMVSVKGEGHRYGWNQDISWQRKMGSLEKHEKMILDAYRKSWRKEDLLLDRYSKITLLGFSEKRRPVLAFYK